MYPVQLKNHGEFYRWDTEKVQGSRFFWISYLLFFQTDIQQPVLIMWVKAVATRFLLPSAR